MDYEHKIKAARKGLTRARTLGMNITGFKKRLLSVTNQQLKKEYHHD